LGWIWWDFQHQSSIWASKVSCFFCNLARFPHYCIFFVASSCEWCVEGRGGVCICFSTGICFLTKWWCSLKSGVGCCRHLGTQRAEVVVMKNCGHAPQIENPREYNRIILNFLQSPAEKSTKDWSGSDWFMNPVISTHKFNSVSVWKFWTAQVLCEKPNNWPMYIISFRLELLSLHIEILDVVSIPIQYLQLIIGTSNIYLF
jgi:hypothetical protein